MNTKTMRLPPRRVLMPNTPTNKRKEREDGFDGPKPSSTTITTTTKLLKPDKPRTGLEPPSAGKGLEPSSSNQNQLLAGYLAHEFLTKGTLFGEPWDPSRAQGPTSNPSVRPVTEKRKGKPSEKREAEPPSGTAEQAQSEKYERYVEVAGLLKADGAHLPGIVNPTQLARFVHL